MNQLRLLLFSLIAFLLLLSLSPVQSQEKQSPGKNQPATQSGTDEITRPIGAPGQAIADLVAKAQSGGPLRVIVGLRVAAQPEGKLIQTAVQTQRRAIALTQTAVLARLTNVRPDSVKRFTHIPFLALEVDAEGLEQLRNSPEVTTIEKDEMKQISLAESVPLIGAPAAWAAGFSGAGQTVAILDTGVDKSHPFLTGKVVSEACYSTNGSQTASVCPGGVPQSTDSGSGVNCTAGGCDHGTHVAGIAAGKSDAFSGVARDANVIAVQVFSRVIGCTGSNCVGAFNSDILMGMQRVFDLRTSFNIAAINLSLGGGASNTNCDASAASFKAAIDNLRSVGIATVVASGNESSTGSLSSPACISTAISVGSTGDGTGSTTVDRVSSFSNSASFLNLLAPGEAINSSVPGGGFAVFRGTSMSTPHVAGAWAVLKSKTPTASVPQVLQALTDAGLPVTDARNGIVKPRIRVDAAATALPTTQCNYAIAPLTQAVAIEGGTSTVNVTTASGCAWTARSNVSWLTINSGSTGTGNGAVSFTASANNGFERTGTLFVAGNTFIVTQPGVPSLAVDDGSFETSSGLGGGGNSFRVNRLTPASYPATINTVAIYFSGDSGVEVGDPLTIIAGVNPGGTATINGIQFAVRVQTTVQALDQFSVYPIPGLTTGAGDFVVGMEINHAPGVFPFAIDTTTPRNRSYRSLDGITFVTIDTVGTAGNYGIRALTTQAVSCPTVTAITPAAGMVGDMVTITGTGFTGVTAVKFTNNVTAQFTVNSDTSITTTVPNNVAPGPILISKAGCADVPTPRFAPAIVTIASADSALTAENCTPANGAIDPGETVIVNLSLRNTGTVDTGTLVATLQTTGGVTSPNGPQTYGVLTAGGAAVTRAFTFTANGECGGTLTATLNLQDGTTSRGTITYTFPLGAPKVTSSENFDGVTAPALPTGWTSVVATGTAPAWVTSSTTSDTAPNNAFTTNPTTVTDIRLDSPSIPVTTAFAQVSFRNNYNLEAGSSATYDGGVLEIAIGSGAFADILAAGGSFVTGGYNRTITESSNPLNGRMAWSSTSNGYITTTVNLPAAAAGQSIKLRWRLGTDSSASATGWRIDTFQVLDGRMCETACSGIPCPIIAIAPATLPAATLNAVYNQTLTASNGTGPYTFALTAGTLPNGLALSAAGVLSGTPTQGGSYNITVKATDANGCMGTRMYTLAVNCPTITPSPTTLPAGTVGTAYNQTFTATGGQTPYTFALSAGILPNGLTLTSAGVLSGTPTQSSNASITIRATDAIGCTGTRTYTLVIACPTITIAPTSPLASGTIGTAYSQTLSATGGAEPYTFAVSAGALPAGLTLSPAGALSGTPTRAGNFTFTARATDANGCTGTRVYMLVINCTVSITIAPATLPDGLGGVAYNQTLTATGGVAPYTFGVITGALPGGLTLASGGVLSGTPNAAGAFTFTVAASDANGCPGTASYTINVTVALDAQTRALYVLRDCDTCANQIFGYAANETTGALTLLPGFPIATGGNGDRYAYSERLAIDAVNQRLFAVNSGSNTVSAFSINPTTGALTALPYSPINLGTLPSGSSRNAVAVHPSGSPLVVGDDDPSGQNGHLASYQITATTATAAAGSPFSMGTASPFSVSFSQDGNYVYSGGDFGAGIAGFGVNATSGVLTPLTGSPFASGGNFPLAYATDADGRLFAANFSAGQLRVFATASGIPAAVTGNPFTSGLTEAVRGLLHPGGFYLVADRSGNRVGVYRIAGSGGGTTLAGVTGSPFASGGSLTGTLALNQAGTFVFAANGDSRNLTTFNINPTTGALGSRVVQTANSLGTTGRLSGLAYLPLVTPPCLTLAPPTLPAGSVGTAYSQTITATGGTAPYSFAVSGGTLPNGLALSSAGVLSGTPARAGSFTFTVRASDGSGCAGARSYTLTVNCTANITLSPATLPNGAAGTAYSQTLTASGGVAPYNFAITTGGLPSGLTLSTGGVISGTPIFGGPFSFTVTATDANNCTGSRSYSVVITGDPGASAGYLYTFNQCSACSNQIYGYIANEATGSLTALPGFPIATGGEGVDTTNSEQLAVDRVNRRLYALNRGSGTISAYSISITNGALTPLPFSPINLGTGEWATIAVHPSGSPLVVGRGISGQLLSYRITATTATAAAGSPYSTGSAQGFSTAFSQDGNYVYTGGNINTTFAGFSVNATTGVLTALTGSPFESGASNPLAYSTDAAGRLYMANAAAGQVRIFTTASGIPTGVTGNPFTSGLTDGTFSLIHPNGFFMVADRGGNRVGVYRIGGNGSGSTLAAVTGSPFVAGGTLTTLLALNQAGTFLFAANGNTRNLTTFGVNVTTGALSAISTQPANALGTAGRLTGMGYLPVVLQCPTITLSPATLPNGTVGTAYSQTITASPAGNYTFAVTAGALPAGLSLNSATGALTGMPTAAGTANFTVTATGANNCTGNRPYTVVITPVPDSRTVRVVPVNATVGGTISVPVELISLGNENAVSFSLTFDPTRLNTPQVALGSGATGAQLTVNPNQAGQGRLGIVLSLPAGQVFGAGNRQLIVVSFTIPLNATIGATSVGFGDQPVRREVVDANARSLTAVFTAGQVTITPEGYEADVAPRPNGDNDGNVTLADAVQIGRFVAGLDTAAAGGEFQRADCAPLNTLGDGRLTVTDWAQAGRYVAGLDPLNRAGGPVEPVATALRSESIAAARQAQQSGGQSPQVRLVIDEQAQQSIRSVTVALDALGDEHALGFSVAFNPSHWRFVSATAGDNAREAALLINTRQAAQGRIGLAMAMPVGRGFGGGERQLVVLRFAPLAGTAPFAVNFGDSPTVREMANIEARTIPARFTANAGALASVSAASFSDEPLAREQIVAAFGQGLANYAISAPTLPLPEELIGTRVVITDSTGAQHAAPLFFVSPTQVNYLIPAAVELGPATVTITAGDGTVVHGLIEIAEVSPSLFAANADGQGVAAAVALRVKADGSQSYEPVATFDSAQQRFVATPIHLGGMGEQVFLLVYGTGLRGQGDVSKIKARIGGLRSEVLYAGAQGDFVGLDQVNLRLPSELAGRGEVDVEFSVNGRAANTVRIRIN